MEPMLRQNRDLVVIQVPNSVLGKFDVALYKRGNSYVLHRVIDVCDDHYLIRGDNTYSAEKVPHSDVIGVLISFQRKGRYHSVDEPGYKAYVRFWNAIYPARAFYVHGRSAGISAARRLGVLPVLKKILRRDKTE